MIVVDRFENDRALVEFDGEVLELPRSCLPAQAREGSVLRLELADEAAILAEGKARLDRLSAATDLPDDVEL